MRKILQPTDNCWLQDRRWHMADRRDSLLFASVFRLYWVRILHTVLYGEETNNSKMQKKNNIYNIDEKNEKWKKKWKTQ